MSHQEFILTPNDLAYFNSMFRNPVTGRWTIPTMMFNTQYASPYFNHSDPLNNDPAYQKTVIDNIYVRLTEKWLYKDPVFLSLLKYFDVTIDGNQGSIRLIDDPDNITSKSNMKYSRHILKYINEYFVTKHFVSKILKQFVKLNDVKWYDLFEYSDILKSLFAKQLKKTIVSTIYQLQKDATKKE